jgi:hypothetical protein
VEWKRTCKVKMRMPESNAVSCTMIYFTAFLAWDASDIFFFLNKTEWPSDH